MLHIPASFLPFSLEHCLFPVIFSKFKSKKEIQYTQAMESGSLDSRQPNGDNPFTRVRYYNSLDHLSISGMKF